MNTTSVETRSSYWDNIKGILILLVVFAHILFQLQNTSELINCTVDFIYLFHMPAFVFVSGYFGRSERSHSFESIIKLIFLYYIFNSTIGLIYGFSSLLQPMYSYWYLIALVAWRLTTHHIAKFKEITLILFVIAIFVGFYPSIDNSFATARVIGFYPFYILGYQLSSEKSRALLQMKYAKRAALGVVIFIALVPLSSIAYDFFCYTDPSFQMEAYSNPMDAFGRICIYIFAYSAIYAIRCLSTEKKLPLITMFGRNSLWIFVLHRPFTLILSDLINGLPTVAIILIACGAAVLMCLVFGNELVTKYLNIFLRQGADIFCSDPKPEKDKKPSLNAAKIALLAVSLAFVITSLLNAYQQPDEPESSNSFRITFADASIIKDTLHTNKGAGHQGVKT